MAYGDAEDISSGAEQPVDFHHERENEAAALLAALVAFSRDAILSCSPQGIIQSWNDGAQRLFGWSSADAVGRSVMFLVTEAGQVAAQNLLDRAVAGFPSQMETELLDRNGRRMEVSLGIAPVRDRRGQVSALSFIIRDLRLRRRSQANDAMLASLVQQSSDAIFSVTRDGLISSWNPASERLYGFTAEEAITQPLSMIVPEAHRSESASMVAAVMRGETVLVETVRQRKDGSTIDIAISGAPLRDSQGAIVGISSIHRDITAQRQHEQQINLVMRELAHRSKNLLSIIISMAGQTARNTSSISDFSTRFIQRLQGLAHSHDLLIQQNWRGASLRELILSHLEPFLEEDHGRVRLIGPDIFVDPKAAQNIGLALHELATNASKYGALTTPSGHIQISWDAGPNAFVLNWRELSGPRVIVPQHRGFGQTVLEKLAAQALEGQSTLTFNAAGVEWRMEIPVAYIVNDDPSPTGS